MKQQSMTIGNGIQIALLTTLAACGARGPAPAQLTNRDLRSEVLVPLRSDAPVQGSWRVLVIPVEFDDWKHDKPLGADNPSNPPVETSALDERYNTLATDYFSVTSRGNMKVSFHVFPRWLNLGKMNRFAGGALSARPLLDQAISKYAAERKEWPEEAQFDKTVVVFSSPSWADEWADEWEGTGWNPDRDFIHPIASISGENGKASCLNAGAGVGVITHELGHSILMLKDKDVGGRIPAYRYQLMGAGSWNGIDLKAPEEYQARDDFKNTMPSLISAWNRVNLGWEPAPLRVGPGTSTFTVDLSPAADEPEATPAVRSLQDTARMIAVEVNANQYFLLENRAQRGWDRALPAWGLLGWSIRPNWRSSSAGDSDYSSGVWESVVDMHPETLDAPATYKYAFIDHRTRAFSAVTHQSTGATFNPLGLFDAPLGVGEQWTVPGTQITMRVVEKTAAEHLIVELANVQKK